MELTYELVKHLIENRKRRQINVLVITYSGSDSSRDESESSWNFRSQERKFPGAKVPWSESSKNFRSRERMFQGAKVPGSESSWNFRSQGAKVPYHRTFAPGSESS